MGQQANWADEARAIGRYGCSTLQVTLHIQVFYFLTFLGNHKEKAGGKMAVMSLFIIIYELSQTDFSLSLRTILVPFILHIGEI